MRRALYRVALALSLAAVVSGGAITYVGFAAVRGPADIVRGYFAALAHGDAAVALGYGALPRGPRDYLTSAVLAEQLRLAPLRALHIGTVTQHDDRASVGYRYQLAFATGTSTVTGRLALHRAGSTWRLATTAVPVTVRSDRAVDRIAVAGAALPAGRVLLFPGALPIRLDTGYLSVSPARPTVKLGPRREIRLQVRASSAARHALTTAVRRRLARCVDRPPPQLACPLPSPRYVPGSLSGRIVGAVRLRFAVTPAAAGMIRASGAVGFRGSYRRLGYDNIAQPQTGPLTLPVRASAYAVRPLRITIGTPR